MELSTSSASRSPRACRRERRSETRGQTERGLLERSVAEHQLRQLPLQVRDRLLEARFVVAKDPCGRANGRAGRTDHLARGHNKSEVL